MAGREKGYGKVYVSSPCRSHGGAESHANFRDTLLEQTPGDMS